MKCICFNMLRLVCFIQARFYPFSFQSLSMMEHGEFENVFDVALISESARMATKILMFNKNIVRNKDLSLIAYLDKILN